MSDKLSVEVEIIDGDANRKLDNFVAKTKMAGKEIEAIGRSPLNPSLDKLRSLEPQKSLLAQGPINPNTTSFARSVSELAPNIKKAREEQEKFVTLLEHATGLTNQQAKYAGLLASKLGLSASSLAALGPLLVAGAAAIAVSYKITTDIRQEAERRLKVEESITAEWNKQRRVAAQLRKEFEDQEKNAAGDRRLSQYLQTAPTYQLEARQKLLTQLIDIYDRRSAGDIDKEALAEYRKELSSLNSTLDETRFKQEQAMKTSAGAAYDQRWENIKRNQLELVKQQEEAAAKFVRSVEEGRKKIEELSSTWKQTFQGLAAGANGNNAFFNFFSKTADDAEKLKKALAGLPPDLQKVALAMKQASDARELFEIRLDTRLKAYNLKQQAEDFRNPFSSAMNEQKQNDIINRFLSENPNYGNSLLDSFRGSVWNADGKLTQAAFEDILSRMGAGRATLNPMADQLNRRLDEQFDLIYGRGRLDRDEQSIADRRFIDLTAGMNPLELSDRNRSAAAEAREREAARAEASEKEAVDRSKKQVELMERINANVEKFVELNQKGGSLAVEIAVKDNTESGLTVSRNPARPSNANTVRDFHLDVVRSGGVLSNR